MSSEIEEEDNKLVGRDIENINLSPPQNLTEQENPFLNPVVLHRFFELCHVEDLARFRLVSKLWYSESLTRFRKETTLEISLFTDPLLKALIGHLDENKPFRSLSLRNFVDMNLLWRSAVKGKWCSWKICDTWTAYGPWIRKLELVNCPLSRSNYFRHVLFLKSEGTPNLEELHMIDCHSPERRQPPRDENEVISMESLRTHPNLQLLRIKLPFTYPTTWRRLLSSFPNLRTLEIDNIEISNSNWTRNVSEWLRELVLICQDFQQGRLSFEVILRNVYFHFKLRRPIPDEMIEGPVLRIEINREIRTVEETIKLILRTLRPRLINSIVEMDVQDWGDEEMSLLAEIIGLGGDTMKQFILKVDRVFGSELEPIRNFPFGVGPNSSITKLHLKGNTCENLHFLEEFPNLEELRLEIRWSNEKLEGTDLTRMGNVKLLKLKDFQYFDESPRVRLPQQVLELFIKMMPNLECFEAPIGKSLLRVVCRDLRQLRELHTDCDRMSDEEKLDDKDLMGIVRGGDRLPNILDMKNLEIFSLRVRKIVDTGPT